MQKNVLKLLYLNRDLGEAGLVPDGSIVNIGGVSGSDFTIGGKGVVLADGTTTGPLGTNTITLQKAYDNSENGILILNSEKDLFFEGTSNQGMRISGLTGDVNIDSDLTVNDVVINGLINGTIDIQNFYDDFQNHVNNDIEVKHTARQISISNSDLTVITANNVQDAISEIDSYLKQTSGMQSFVFEETVGMTTWEILHGKNSTNAAITIFDETGSTIIPDEIKIIDSNTLNVVFYTAQQGKAVIIFV
jgi:ribosomal protein L30E